MIGFIFVSIHVVYPVRAETVSGNGYIINQVISPLQGFVSGAGYRAEQTGQITSGVISGGGYQSQSVFGTSTTPTQPAPIVTVSGSSGGGWGYYVFTGTSTNVGTSTNGTATTSLPLKEDTILTANGSSCSTRIALSQPVDIGLKNDPVDVKKLETFLNTYEGENLKVDGFYGKEDLIAVKKWQAKYKATVLAPLRLKNPTGTVYTSSMRQIERQTTANCGKQIMVHSCPFFKADAKYGNTGDEVKKLQQFLNIARGEKLPINGKYGPSTRDAVKRFQRMYRKDIVSIIRLSFITGNWNVMTRAKANEVIGCPVVR